MFPFSTKSMSSSTAIFAQLSSASSVTYVMYPYNDKEPDEEPMPLTFEQVEEANAAEIKKSEEAVEELPTNFEPYDVSKDLGFDDEE